jgi:hypothetical protein
MLLRCLTPLIVAQVSIGIDPMVVFKEADWCLMIGAKPRGPGMERADLLDMNGRIFVEQVIHHCGCIQTLSEALQIPVNGLTRRRTSSVQWHSQPPCHAQTHTCAANCLY